LFHLRRGGDKIKEKKGSIVQPLSPEQRRRKKKRGKGEEEPFLSAFQSLAPVATKKKKRRITVSSLATGVGQGGQKNPARLTGVEIHREKERKEFGT